MLRILNLLLFLLISCAAVAQNASLKTARTTKVGVPTVLSGDLAVLGDNIAKTVETYRRHYLRHPLQFILEDARKGSVDGLRSYQRLINFEHVDLLIGGTTSNGTLAAKELINSSHTPLITPLTGGSNIDKAGPYVFRIGNSDILNGRQQAELFAEQGLRKIALLTEETEYTQDISNFFRQKHLELGGSLAFDDDFVPETTDFRALITKILRRKPQALFVSTQTGLAFGIFLRQLNQMGVSNKLPIHTNFVAASNPDASKAAGEHIYGVHYLSPRYGQDSPELQKFFARYQEDHGHAPTIAFHTAGTVDALNMLQSYLDDHPKFDAQGFQSYLLDKIKGYQGLMGRYSFDGQGNADIGFIPAVITGQ